MKLLERRIKVLKREASELRKEAYNIDQKISKIKENLKKVCKHSKSKIVTQSYEEPGRVKYFEWREKICTKCGKVLGTSSEETTWSKFE